MKKTVLIFTLFIISQYISYSQIANDLKITDISIDTIGNLKWTAFSPNGFIKGQVEIFREDKWDTVCNYSYEPIVLLKIRGDGGRVKGSAKIVLRHGTNRIRIRITAPYISISEEVVAVKKALDIYDHNPLIIKDSISFSTNASYQIYDKKFKSLLKGDGVIVDMSSFKRGIYYLRTDSSVGLHKVIKK